MGHLFIKQVDSIYLGPTCLTMVCRHYKKNIPIQTLRDKTQIGKEGVNLLGISEAAEQIGFCINAVKITHCQLPKQVLNNWYMADEKDYDLFAAKFPMNGELKQQDAKVDAMYNWCNEMKIEFTPTFFVNGHQLPENYNIKDLNIFLSSSPWKESLQGERLQLQMQPAGGRYCVHGLKREAIISNSKLKQNEKV